MILIASLIGTFLFPNYNLLCATVTNLKKKNVWITPNCFSNTKKDSNRMPIKLFYISFHCSANIPISHSFL